MKMLCWRLATPLLAGLLVMVAAPVSAQVYPYNSTQATHACPVSSGGTTCFGGLLYRSSDGTCQPDPRPGVNATQNFACSSVSFICNTASFPCGGCTAATSTIGAACNAPSGGAYSGQCGQCSCGAGKTLCANTNSCVTTLNCSAGTTFDPCTNSCSTPNVLKDQAVAQSGYINITGDVKSSLGSLVLSGAGGGQGNIYLPNGKAIVVAGATPTTFSIGNDFTPATAANLYVFGSAFARDSVSVTNGNFSVGFKAPTLTASTVWTLPADDGVAGQFLQTDGLNNLTWATAAAAGGGAVNAFENGGNSFSGPAILGTNDGNTLAFETNGVARMTIDTNGKVGIGMAVPVAKVDVVGSSSTVGESGTGIKVVSTDTSADAAGTNYAYGINASLTRSGALAGTTLAYGGYFSANAAGNAGTVGAYGTMGSASGAATTYGTFGTSSGSSFAYGTYGFGNGSGTSYGAYGSASGTTAVGSYGVANGTMSTYGVYGSANGSSPSGYGGYFYGGGTSGTRYGVFASVLAGGNAYPGVFMNGNVGIGTTVPGTQLQIHNATSGPIVSLSGLNTNYRGVSLKDTGNVEKWFVGNNDSNDFVIRLAGGSNPVTVSSGNGNIGIGDSSPASLLTVGATDAFQVNASGDLARLKGVTYSWPAAQGAAGTALVNDGAGTLSWSPISTNACATTRKFVGYTTGTYDGNVDQVAPSAPGAGSMGYLAADALCNSMGGAYAGSTVCTAEEVMNSYKCQPPANAALAGVAGTKAWVNSGPPGYTAYSNDCNGWTDDRNVDPNKYFGRIWEFSAQGGRGLSMTCQNRNAYACCK